RVQQSKPAPLAETAPEPAIASPRPAGSPSAPSLPISQPAANLWASAPAKQAPAKDADAPALKSKPAPVPPSPAKPKDETSPGGLRSKFKQWLHPVSSPSDRRRAARRYVPGMVAHYFTG